MNLWIEHPDSPVAPLLLDFSLSPEPILNFNHFTLNTIIPLELHLNFKTLKTLPDICNSSKRASYPIKLDHSLLVPHHGVHLQHFVFSHCSRFWGRRQLDLLWHQPLTWYWSLEYCWLDVVPRVLSSLLTTYKYNFSTKSLIKITKLPRSPKCPPQHCSTPLLFLPSNFLKPNHIAASIERSNLYSLPSTNVRNPF